MSDGEEDVELLREAGAYEDDADVTADALRILLRTKPGPRTELAVETYRRERVSLNRAAETAGPSPAEFRERLHERGGSRAAGFRSEAERDRRLGER